MSGPGRLASVHKDEENKYMQLYESSDILKV